MPRKASKTKTDAEKAADFKRLAEKHGNTILNGFRKLANLGNANKYKHTPAQIKALGEAFDAAGEECFAALEGKQTVSGGLSL